MVQLPSMFMSIRSEATNVALEFIIKSLVKSIVGSFAVALTATTLPLPIVVVAVVSVPLRIVYVGELEVGARKSDEYVAAVTFVDDVAVYQNGAVCTVNVPESLSGVPPPKSTHGDTPAFRVLFKPTFRKPFMVVVAVPVFVRVVAELLAISRFRNHH